MLRLCLRTRRYCYFRPSKHHRRPRLFSSSSETPIEPPNNLKNPHQVPTSPVLHQHQYPSPLVPPSPPNSFLSRNSILALSATTLLSALLAFYALNDQNHRHSTSNPLYDGIERVIETSSDSLKKFFHHVKQTGVAASVLWQSLRSVLSSANQEVRSGFELRVAALLADIAAANASRRAAIVGAGGGAVVDWLMESVASPRDGFGTQAESARALAYLIADPNVSATVLGRPRAVPNLLRFIFSSHPRRSKKVSF